jgi:hypothetical protein
MAKAKAKSTSSADPPADGAAETPRAGARAASGATRKATATKAATRKTAAKKTATKAATRKTTASKAPAKAAKKASTRKTAKKTAASLVEPKTKPRRKASARTSPRRTIRCYLCGVEFEVSTRTMSTTCTGCHKAIKVEDVQVKSYVPVNDLQTCGGIRVTRRGRVAAKNVQCGEGIVCEGSIEGSIETDGDVRLGPKASWKGKTLHSQSLVVEEGATLNGRVDVPWKRV